MEIEIHFQFRSIMRFRLFLIVCLLASLAAAPALCQTSSSEESANSQPTAEKSGPGIQDNSFLVEEAYNQEDGVVQHISAFERLASSGDWVYTLTDEWPLRTQKHQVSVTLGAVHSGSYRNSGEGWGDTAFNYRYQLIGSGETKVAVAPRFSVLVASGDETQGRGFGGTGIQINLPLSIQHNKWLVTHWNLGTTLIPHQRDAAEDRAAAHDVNLGQSFIFQPSNRFNVMLETIWTSNELVVARDKTVRQQNLFLNPGIRWAYNFKSGLQIVPGIGVPVGVGPSQGEKGVFLYLSFEHPLAWAHSKK